MSEPYRYRRKIVNIGNSRYVIIPADWKHHDGKEVILEVYPDKIIIRPAS